VPEPSLLHPHPGLQRRSAHRTGAARLCGSILQRNYSGKFQIVVVLNGCTDNTLGVVQKVASQKIFSTHQLSGIFGEPIGKGGALIEGLKLAPLGDLIGYVDADGATSPQAFFELVKAHWRSGLRHRLALAAGHPCCIRRSRRLRRIVASRCYHVIVEIFSGCTSRTRNVPCKVLRREAVEKIHRRIC
jgi:cellulose synthase/poly-beta-1,6-N-acetylglucosamine synthase-like glycosyltransferase